jgi:hypothetical protein
MHISRVTFSDEDSLRRISLRIAWKHYVSLSAALAEPSNSGLQEDASSPVQDNSYDANDESQLSASMEPSVEASVEASMEVSHDSRCFSLAPFPGQHFSPPCPPERSPSSPSLGPSPLFPSAHLRAQHRHAARAARASRTPWEPARQHMAPPAGHAQSSADGGACVCACVRACGW